jgi:hypothetical protein
MKQLLLVYSFLFLAGATAMLLYAIFWSIVLPGHLL